MTTLLASRALWIGAACLATAVLAGCGGGGGGSDGDTMQPPPAADDSVPDAALASWMAYSKYAGSLSSDDQKEPLKLDKVTQAPVTDSDEPMGL